MGNVRRWLRGLILLRLGDERLDPLDPDAVSLGKADVDATLPLELLARAHEDDPGEPTPAIEAQVVRLGRLLPGARPRRADRCVQHVAGRIVGDVRKRVAPCPEAHPDQANGSYVL